MIGDIAKHPLATVLVMGQTGTGKGVAVRRIHELTHPRLDTPFVEINCATIPKELFESELFGHEKGAFTGAHTSKPGLLEVARHGTAFLDEIGELHPFQQAKLLNVLEERIFKRVGGTVPVKLSARVIAATNRPLIEMVKTQKFREDLYYRLNMYEIHIPPLRDCKEDILPMAQHFAERFARQHGKRIQHLPREASDIFMEYSFPGNIRELRNLVERAVIRSQGDILNVQEIINHTLPRSSASLLNDSPSTLSDCAHDDSPTSHPNCKGVFSIDGAERQLVIQAMKASKGNKTVAAEMLGLSRTALFRRLNKLGLSRHSEPTDNL
jgi:transcriptional regulator with GAF, ATPase, and Fis domain